MKVVTPLPQFQDSRINVDFDDSKSRFPASKLRQWRHLYGSNKSQNDGGFICPVELSKECILTFGCRKTKAMIKKKKHHHDKHKALKHKYRRVSRFIFVEKTVLLEDGSFARRMCVLGEMKVAYEKPARSLSGFIPSIFSRKRKRNANDESEDSELSVSKKRKLNKPNNQQKPSNTNNSEANHGVVVGSDLFALKLLYWPTLVKMAASISLSDVNEVKSFLSRGNDEIQSIYTHYKDATAEQPVHFLFAATASTVRAQFIAVKQHCIHWIQSSAKGMRLRDTIIEMIGCDDTNGIEKLSIEIEREMMRNTNTIARDFWTLWILCQSQVRSSSAWCEGLGNLIKGNTTHVVGKGKAFENIDNFTWLGSHCDDSEQAISSICTATTHHLVNKGSGVAMKDRERDKKKRKDSEGIGKVNIRCAKGNKERKFATELKLNQNEMLQLLNK
eukprot:113501_1